MKKYCLIILILLSLTINNFASSEDTVKDLEDILQNATKTTLEYNSELERTETGEIKFKVKKANLWLNENPADKKKLDEFVEITLPGKLYNSQKKIKSVEKKDVDRSTIEGAITSVFSANKSGDLEWIVENFIDKDEETIRSIFTENNLEKNKATAEKITTTYISGEVNYKDSVIVFIEQDYSDRGKMKESLALKKTDKGWKVTNEFSSDKTFDIVFAAVSTGEVSLKGKESPKEKSAKDSKS